MCVRCQSVWSSGWLMWGFLHRRLLASVGSLPLPFQPFPHALVLCCGCRLRCTDGETKAQAHKVWGPAHSASRPHAGPCSEGRWVGPRLEQSVASPTAVPRSPQTLGVTFPAPPATPTHRHQQSRQLFSPKVSTGCPLWSRLPVCSRGRWAEAPLAVGRVGALSRHWVGPWKGSTGLGGGSGERGVWGPRAPSLGPGAFQGGSRRQLASRMAPGTEADQSASSREVGPTFWVGPRAAISSTVRQGPPMGLPPRPQATGHSSGDLRRTWEPGARWGTLGAGTWAGSSPFL